MTAKRRASGNASGHAAGRPDPAPGPVSRSGRRVGTSAAGPVRPSRALVAAGAIVTALAVLVLGWVVVSQAGGRGSPAGQTVVAGTGGQWTNVTADRLAGMLRAKDFTLVNVKTPYIGEISGTDLYIPYDQLTTRKAELPQSRSAKILVYCRSGAESRLAAQTLIDLGYTNVWNLDGGMNAWTASGRSLVNLGR